MSTGCRSSRFELEPKLAAPRLRRWRTTGNAADEGFGQALRNQDVADVTIVDAKDTAAATVVAAVGPFGAGLAGAANSFEAQPALRNQLTKPGLGLQAESALLRAARLDRFGC